MEKGSKDPSLGRAITEGRQIDMGVLSHHSYSLEDGKMKINQMKWGELEENFPLWNTFTCMGLAADFRGVFFLL